MEGAGEGLLGLGFFGGYWLLGGALAAGSAGVDIFLNSGVKNYSPGYMEQEPRRGHEASPQIGLGVGCKLCSSSKKLCGLSARAQTRHIRMPLSRSLLRGFPRSCLPRVARRATRSGA